MTSNASSSATNKSKTGAATRFTVMVETVSGREQTEIGSTTSIFGTNPSTTANMSKVAPRIPCCCRQISRVFVCSAAKRMATEMGACVRHPTHLLRVCGRRHNCNDYRIWRRKVISFDDINQSHHPRRQICRTWSRKPYFLQRTNHLRLAKAFRNYSRAEKPFIFTSKLFLAANVLNLAS